MNHRHVHTNEIVVICMFWWSSVFWFTHTGVLQHPDGTILKQLQPPPRGPREMLFYTQVTDFHSELCKSCKCIRSKTIWTEAHVTVLQVYDKDTKDMRLLDLQHHLPKFYGTWAPRGSPHGEIQSNTVLQQFWTWQFLWICTISFVCFCKAVLILYIFKYL